MSLEVNKTVLSTWHLLSGSLAKPRLWKGAAFKAVPQGAKMGGSGLTKETNKHSKISNFYHSGFKKKDRSNPKCWITGWFSAQSAIAYSQKWRHVVWVAPMQTSQSRELCLDHIRDNTSVARSTGISISRIFAKSGSKISMVVECVSNPEEIAHHLCKSLSALCWCFPQHAKLAKDWMVLSVKPSRYAAAAYLCAALTWISFGSFRKIQTNNQTKHSLFKIFKEIVSSNQW